MKIKEQIFFGNRGCMEACYHLHRIMEEAFTIIGGIQQPPLPCDTEESSQAYEQECLEGKEDVRQIANEIVKGLLGKDYEIRYKWMGRNCGIKKEHIKTLPEKLYRKDDNEVFLLLPDEQLYVMERSMMHNPYKYSYARLMETGAFSDKLTEYN